MLGVTEYWEFPWPGGDGGTKPWPGMKMLGEIEGTCNFPES